MAGDQKTLIELVNRARSGNSEALERLLDRVRHPVVRYVQGRVQSRPGSRWLAEEISQEVLIRVVKHIDQCRAQSAREFHSWLHTIARRAVTDSWRKRERELDRRLHESDREVGTRWLRQALAWRDREDGAEADDVDRALGRLLMQAQGELSPGTREVVRRQLLLNETWAETGRAIGTTGPGAKRRWQRAVPRMKREVLRRVARLPSNLRGKVLTRLGVSEDEA